MSQFGNPGVPRLAGATELRTVAVKTKLSESEVQALEEFAGSLSVSRSAAIRSLVLSGLRANGSRGNSVA